MIGTLRTLIDLTKHSSSCVLQVVPQTSKDQKKERKPAPARKQVCLQMVVAKPAASPRLKRNRPCVPGKSLRRRCRSAAAHRPRQALAFLTSCSHMIKPAPADPNAPSLQFCKWLMPHSFSESQGGASPRASPGSEVLLDSGCQPCSMLCTTVSPRLWRCLRRSRSC